MGQIWTVDPEGMAAQLHPEDGLTLTVCRVSRIVAKLERGVSDEWHAESTKSDGRPAKDHGRFVGIVAAMAALARAFKLPGPMIWQLGPDGPFPGSPTWLDGWAHGRGGLDIADHPGQTFSEWRAGFAQGRREFEEAIKDAIHRAGVRKAAGVLGPCSQRCGRRAEGVTLSPMARIVVWDCATCAERAITEYRDKLQDRWYFAQPLDTVSDVLCRWRTPETVS